MLALPEGTRLYLLAPLVRGRKGEYRKELAEYLKRVSAGQDRRQVPRARRKRRARQEVSARHRCGGGPHRRAPDIAQRLAESFETALELAEGPGRGRVRRCACGAEPPTRRRRRRPQRSTTVRTERLLFSEKFACPVSGFTIPEIEPRLFSFNNPYGACPQCGGLGVEQHIDADLVVPDKELTLRKGAIAPWAKSSSPYYVQTLTALGKFYSSPSTPVEGPAEEDAGRHPARLRRGRDQVLL